MDCRYNYRYQGGESYRDVVIRLEPIIMEMERGSDIMVVTHQAILRCIYAYFMNVPQDQSPWMEIPLHTVIKLTPRAYGTQEERSVNSNVSFLSIADFSADLRQISPRCPLLEPSIPLPIWAARLPLSTPRGLSPLSPEPRQMELLPLMMMLKLPLKKWAPSPLSRVLGSMVIRLSWSSLYAMN